MTSPLLALRASVAFTQIVRDPSRLDVVFDLVDSLSNDPASSAELATLLEDPIIADAARRRVRVPELALDTLSALPEGSFGHTAASFFRAHGLDPAALPRREAATDVDWLSAHLYETHDLWHVVTGFGPDVPGELGLQAFYAAQVEGPVALAILTAGMLNTVIFAQHERRARLTAIARGWEMGTRAKSLVGLDWAQRLSQPLAQIRAELGIDVEREHDAMAALAPRPLAA